MIPTLAAELGALADAATAWLKDAAEYFAKRDTRGEDRAHWSNVYNAENCLKIATTIKALLARLGELEKERAEIYETMNHAHIFIYTREKMHPDGRLLYEDLLRRLAPSPKPAQEA